jgi:diguanylate cyclase (GGDEF)-like protein
MAWRLLTLEFPMIHAVPKLAPAGADDLDALLSRAWSLADRTDARAGLELALRAVDIARSRGDAARTSRALTIVCGARRALADFPGAANAALEAIELLQAADITSGRAMVRVQAAMVFFDLGDYERALNILDEARHDLVRDDDPMADSQCAHAEGMVQSRLGEFELARASFERALRLRRRMRHNDGVAVTLNSLGVLHLRRAQLMEPGGTDAAQEFARARGCFKEARELADKVGDTRLALLAAINLAGASGGEGRVDDALAQFLALLPTARANGDRSNESLLLANAGEAARLAGDIAQSRKLCEEALAVAQAIASKVREQQAHLQLSLTCEAAGDLGAALSHYKAQHALEREMHAGQARRLAEAQSLRGEVERARQETAKLRRARRNLERENRKLVRQAREDPLTGLANRRAFDAALDARLADARAQARPLAVVLFDIDGFKSINDRFTHAIGDSVLREVAALLQAHCRASDIAARIGGEEFVLLLREADRESARNVAERVRSEIAARDWSPVAAGLTVTISGGVAVDPGEGGAAALVRDADIALYEAKRAGRNRVCVS